MITETYYKHGVSFRVFDDVDQANDIHRWLVENRIQYFSDYMKLEEYHYFIRDETSIMAFKLRWM